MTSKTAPTIAQAAKNFIESVSQTRSANTARTYRNALNDFLRVININHINPEERPLASFLKKR